MLFIRCLHLNQVTITIWGSSTLILDPRTPLIGDLISWRAFILLWSILFTSLSLDTWADCLIAEPRKKDNILYLRVDSLSRRLDLLDVLLFNLVNVVQEGALTRLDVQLRSVHLDIVYVLFLLLHDHRRLSFVHLLALPSSRLVIHAPLGCSGSTTRSCLASILPIATSTASLSQGFILWARDERFEFVLALLIYLLFCWWEKLLSWCRFTIIPQMWRSKIVCRHGRKNLFIAIMQDLVLIWWPPNRIIETRKIRRIPNFYQSLCKI